MTDLKRCPCGKVPQHIDVVETGKYAMACPSCCGEWHFEFRASHKTGSELQQLANEAWNDMPRGAVVVPLEPVTNPLPPGSERN